MLGTLKMTNNLRRVGAPLGNRNALMHGRRTAHAELQRRISLARLKALMILGNSVEMFDPAPKPRPLRLDQLALLRALSPELFAHLKSIRFR